MNRTRRGFTLVELIIVLVILFLALVLILPAILSQRQGPVRGTQCMSNIRQLGLAMISFDAAKNRLPNSGTYAAESDNPDGTDALPASLLDTGGTDYPGGTTSATTNDIRWDYPLHSWVVDILPYMERSDIYDLWQVGRLRNDTTGRALAMFDEKDWTPGSPNNGYDKKGSTSHYALSQTYLALLVCPNDSPDTGKGNLSYAVNGGPVLYWQKPENNSAMPAPLDFAGVSPSTAPPYAKENQKAASNLGLLYPGSLNNNTPWDTRRSLARIPDGTSTTIMIGENLKTGYIPSYPGPVDPPLPFNGAMIHSGAPGPGQIEGTWANPDARFSAFHVSDDFCDPRGNCAISPQIEVRTEGGTVQVRRANWPKANSIEARDNIQQLPESINGALYADEGWSYLNGLHPGGVVVVMCDGSIKFLSNDISGDVLAKLMSPAGHRTMNEMWPVFQDPIKEEDF